VVSASLIGRETVSDNNDEQEIARLERLNSDLKRSLRRCRDMLHDYEVRLTANLNEPERPSDQLDSEAR